MTGVLWGGPVDHTSGQATQDQSTNVNQCRVKLLYITLYILYVEYCNLDTYYIIYAYINHI